MNYIYTIRNSANGKFYIGRTNNPSARKRCHWSELSRGVHSNPRLQNSWNKHGKNVFSFNVVDSAPEKDIEAKEAEWFDKFNCDKSILYNCHFETFGGPKTYVPMSDAVKLKISEAIKDGTRKYIFNILDEGYSSKVGLNTLAKRYSVGSTTLLCYIKEWEVLKGAEYGHPQTRSTLERVELFVSDFHKSDVVPNFRNYNLSKKSLDKYLPMFNLTRQDVLLDEWKQVSVEKALAAIRLVKETGCSALLAMKETGASTTTFYKYLKEQNAIH